MRGSSRRTCGHAALDSTGVCGFQGGAGGDRTTGVRLEGDHQGRALCLERDPEGVGHKTQDLEGLIFMQDTPDELPDLKIFYLVEPGIATLLAVRAADPSPF